MVAASLFSLLLILPYALGSAHGARSCSNNPVNSTTSDYTTPFDLAIIYGLLTSNQDAVAANEIHNTFALYFLAIDGKNFDALPEVFTEDIVANYTTTLGIWTSIPAIATGIENAIKYVITQHQLGTQAMDVKKHSCEARSVTYFTASHFGQKKYANQVVTVYGHYQDNWRKTSTGKWKISARSLVYMGNVVGDQEIFQPS